MSFTSKEHIQRLIEGLLHYVWPKDLGVLNLPFPEISYKEAMSKYGVDKPDTRFENLVTMSVSFLIHHLKPFKLASRCHRYR